MERNILTGKVLWRASVQNLSAPKPNGLVAVALILLTSIDDSLHNDKRQFP